MNWHETPNERTSRRKFLGQAAGGGAALLWGRTSWSATTPAAWTNPYAGVDWSAVRQIGSGSHIHCREQRSLEILYRRGLRHLAISNYYPSVPCTAAERQNQYRVEQKFPTMANGAYSEGPFLWNEILLDPKTGWRNELPEELQKTLPFKLGGPLFAEVPEDVIICPNAEHHSMTDLGAHVNGLGSQFASGNFDARGKYHLPRHGYPVGVNLPWKETFRKIFAELEVEDGGGLTINHPVWSRLPDKTLLELLDFDPRVLGIEIWNHTCEQLNHKGWALDEWDRILKTGRRCYGFAVSDHVHRGDPTFRGYNVLLIDSQTPPAELPAACLRAYRQGRFYCTLTGDLRFEKLERVGGRLQVVTNAPCRIQFRTAAGAAFTHEGTTAEWAIPGGPANLAEHVFVRIEARQLDGKDRLFSQPIPLR